MKKKKITQSKIKEPGPENKEKKEEKKEEGKRKPGRPTIFTPELRAKLIKLFEENFFIAIVAASADIYRQQIEEWEREHKDFHANVTHARDKWIRQQMKLLDQYAIDKKTKDWRALKYKLSIADAEYNDKKYLREAPGSRESPQITIIINRKDLKTSKEEAYKIIGESSHKEETISLITFKEEKKEKKGEKRQKAKSGEAKT
jgi:glutaredoxin